MTLKIKAGKRYRAENVQMEYRKAMWDSTVQDYVREMRNY